MKITLEVELQFNAAEDANEPDSETIAASLVDEITALIEGDPDEVLDLGEGQEFENVDVITVQPEALP